MASALAIPAIEDQALIGRNGVEQALLGNVGNEPIELGALHQRQYVGERVKWFCSHVCTVLSL